MTHHLPDFRAPETETTISTYDRIAAEYAEQWADTTLLAEHRRRFVALLPAGARVLDVGCGPGRETLCLRDLGLRVFGLDRSPGMLDQARRRGVTALVLGDMRMLPIPSASLDGLWVCASFLHIPKREARDVLYELRRALCSDGLLFVCVKRGEGERWVETASGARFFVFYLETELDQLLAEAGFEVCDAWLDSDKHGREPWICRLALACGP